MADSDALPAPGSAQLDAHGTGDASRPRVALALGSGGARGYAHIGVIHELRDRGYQIVGIAGSSMGALVGGLQAADRLDEFADWAQSLTQRAILRLLDPSITAAGVLRAEKILDAVRDILGAATIEELPIPYTAVATDLLAGAGIPAPLPMAPIAAVNADLTIAVSLSGSETLADAEPEPRPTTEWLNRMLTSTSALLDSPTARAVLDRFGASSADDPEDAGDTEDSASVPES